MVLDEARGVSIHGEIWEVDADCLMRLDDLEDIAGGEYARELIPLLPPFDHQPIQGYRYLRELTDEPDCGACW